MIELHEEFIDIYNEIESFLRNEYSSSKQNERIGHTSLIYQSSNENPIIKQYKEDLISFARLRNAIVHSAYESKPIAEPHKDIVSKYKDIRDRILFPLKTWDKCIKNIYSCKLSSNLNLVMNDMKKNVYTHVPVVNDKGFTIGILSENSLFNCILKEEIFEIEKTSTVELIKDYIGINDYDEKFYFLRKIDKLTEVYKIFENAIKNRERIGSVFITENGKMDNKIIGMFTSEDIAGQSI
ncbi:MAG: hypothetical protein CMP75_04840 [Flavobacteriales bacterium]|nr:hypothetical protein [Flavobacteriales bacterium]|tara:strand:- start:2098 stop:2814 length:717 start_codon:yes stop_codon:yes gene_type:complete